jgi:hypothetical protein
MTCFECHATENLHHHHVVPRSLGGTKTIPLCERCHSLVHSKDFTSMSALTSKAMQKKKAQGLYTGGRAPFGFKLGDDGKTLVPNPAEVDIILCAQELRRDGHSLRGISAELAERGMVNRQGAPFDSKVVRSTLLAAKPESMSLKEINAELAQLAKLAWVTKPRKWSLRAISVELASRGMVNRKGKSFEPNSIAELLTMKVAPQGSLFGGDL